jgi:hypothetical protein
VDNEWDKRLRMIIIFLFVNQIFIPGITSLSQQAEISIPSFISLIQEAENGARARELAN